MSTKTKSTSHTNTETTMTEKHTKPTTTHHEETTMTTGTKAAAAKTTTTSAIAAQLQGIEASCGYGDPLTDAARRTSNALIRRVPDTIVERILALAVRGGGIVAGITLDPVAAKAALSAADDADQVATAALMLARRAEDQSIRLRSGVSGNVSAIRTAMVGYAKTPQGAALRQENDEIRSLARQHKAAAKGRKTRAEKSVTAAASTSPPEGDAHAEPLTTATATTVPTTASH